jgi:hypothetical protein
MTPSDKAQKGRDLIKEAVIEMLGASNRAMTHAEIVNHLGIPSDFEGVGKNYLSWSILGLLVNSRQIRYRGDRQKRVYYLREDQLR